MALEIHVEAQKLFPKFEPKEEFLTPSQSTYYGYFKKKGVKKLLEGTDRCDKGTLKQNGDGNVFSEWKKRILL